MRGPTRSSSRGSRGRGAGPAPSPVELAIRYLASRRRFEREVRTHLRRKGIAVAEIGEAIERLRELDLLDDDETCRAWIRDKLRFSPRGREQLRLQLRRHGVEEDLVDRALAEVYPGAAEVEAAADVLRRARGRFARLPSAEARRKMWAALSRRGFDREAVREAVARWFEEHGGGESE